MNNQIQVSINKHYNKLVVSFLIIAVLIVLFTGYFAFANTTITIIPNHQKIKADVEKSSNELDVKILNLELENNFIYDDLSANSEAVEEGYAEGIITIYNDSSSSQSLIATTRLLSKEGILFRTQKDVSIPANDSVDVEVKADQIGKDGDIGPSDFEIVALNDAKKKVIYGKSQNKMSGGILNGAIISETDILNAKEAAKEDLLSKAKDEFSKQLNTDIYKKEVQISKIISEDTLDKIGDKTNNITVNLKMAFTYSDLDKIKLQNICTPILSQKKQGNYSINLADKIEYESATNETDTILTIHCTGNAAINDKSDIFDKSKLTNKTKEQVITYFKGFKEVKNVDVAFSPFWVKTTPFIQENIIIKIDDNL